MANQKAQQQIVKNNNKSDRKFKLYKSYPTLDGYYHQRPYSNC